MTDAELFRKCRSGDPAAWRQLIGQLTPTVYRLAVRMLGTGGEAEDACQEVFMRVHESFDTFDPTRTLKPWASKITYNVCLRRLGKPARKLTATANPEELGRVRDESAPGPEANAVATEAGEMLESALDELSAQDQALVSLRYREGLSLAEVSEATGIAVNTVKIRLHRARKKLKTMLGPVLRET